MKETISYRKGRIHDIIAQPLAKFLDERGWLAELFRSDELEPGLMPTMAYISMTQPGVARGPHEHVDQTDYFCFIGPSNFKVYLWAARPKSSTHGNRAVRVVGDSAPFG